MSTVEIDKGFAWAVPVGGFIANFIVGGLAKSYGIIMSSIKDLFDCSAGPLTLAGGLIYTFMYSLSLVGILLSQKYGCRTVINIGGIGCVLSFVGAFFATSVSMWVFCIGGGVGVSLAFIYSPIFVMVGRCFRKQVGVAMGISVAGVSVGQMAFPYMISYVIDIYGARGSMLIGGGISSHFFLTAALMPRFIASEVTDKELKTNKDRRVSKPSDSDSIEKVPLTELTNGNVPNENIEIDKPKKIKSKSTFTNLHITMLIIFVAAKVFADIGDVGLAFALPLYGEKTLLLNNQEISSAIAVAGIVDLIVRIFVGLISDQSWCRRSLLLTFAWLLEGFNTLFFLWSPYKVSYFVFYGIFGLSSGIAITIMTVVLTDLVGHVNLPIGFAVMMFAVGLVISPGQYLVGHLGDVTGSYVWTMRFLAINMFIAFALMALEYPVKKVLFNTTIATDVKFQENKCLVNDNDNNKDNDNIESLPKIAYRDPRSRVSSISTLSNVDVLELLTTTHHDVPV